MLLEQSIGYYQRAMSATARPPQSDIEAKAHFGLGRAYLWQAILLQGDMSQAAQEFKWVITDYNTRRLERLRERAAEAHSELGFIYRLTGEDSAAIAEHKLAITLIENDSRLVGTLATFYDALGDEYAQAGMPTDAAAARQKAAELRSSQ